MCVLSHSLSYEREGKKKINGHKIGKKEEKPHLTTQLSHHNPPKLCSPAPPLAPDVASFTTNRHRPCRCYVHTSSVSPVISGDQVKLKVEQ